MNTMCIISSFRYTLFSGFKSHSDQLSIATSKNTPYPKIPLIHTKHIYGQRTNLKQVHLEASILTFFRWCKLRTMFKVNNKDTRIHKVNDKVKNKDTDDAILAYLLLTWNIFHLLLVFPLLTLFS